MKTTAFAVMIATAAFVRAQSFEVASIKQNNSKDQPRLGVQYLPGGKLSATNIPLYLIIANAYGVSFQSVRLSGGPDWVRSERYDIEATAEQGAIPAGASSQVRNEKMRLMLQKLLADRFKLTIRRENKEIPVYAITVSKNGAKLKTAKIAEKDCKESPTPTETSCHGLSGGQGRGIHGQAVSVTDIAGFVENWTDHPVLDQTGIQGLFDVNTDGWSPLVQRQGAPTEGPEAVAAADPSRPTIADVFEQLGLKWEAKKALVETFVIESVARPSEN